MYVETSDSFEVDIDVPGVKKEDITIDVKDRYSLR